MRPASRRIRLAYRRTTIAAVMLIITGLVATPVQAAGSGRTTPPATQDAPGGPGAMSHFDLARKDCLGTARNSTSKVWFTVANGVLSDVYYPTIDNTNNETLQFVVTDGSTFTDLQTRDMTYQVSALDDSGMSCRVTSTAKNGLYTLTTDYFTDPQRNSVVMRTRFKASQAERAVSAVRPVRRHDQRQRRWRYRDEYERRRRRLPSSTPAPDHRCRSPSTPSPRPPRPTATTPLRSLRRCAPTGRSWPPPAASPAPPSDGLAQLDTDRRLATTYANATQGNVVQTAQLDVRGGRSATLALGFGSTQAAAVATAGATAKADPDRTLNAYQRGWKAYDKRAQRTGRADAACPARSARQLDAHLLPVRERAEGQRGQDVPGRRGRVTGQPVGPGGAGG